LLLGIIDRPRDTLANVLAYPRGRWLAPLALAAVALIVSVTLTAPLLTRQAETMLAEQLSQLPASQVAQFQGQLAAFQTPLVIGGTAVATGVLGLLLAWLIQGAFFYFAIQVAGGEADFRAIYAATPWVSLPFVLETLLQTGFILGRGQLIVNQGLSYLVSVGKPLEDARNLAYVALSQASLFRLWHWLLVYLLLRIGGRLGSGAAFVLTLVYAVAGIGLQMGLAALSGVMTPSL
jgi:hypothetical protein